MLYSLRTVEGVIYLLYPTGEQTGMKWEEKDAAAAQAELARYNSTPRDTLTEAERAWIAAHPDDQGAIVEGQEPVRPMTGFPALLTPDQRTAALSYRGPDMTERVNIVSDDLDALVELGKMVLAEHGRRGLQRVIAAVKAAGEELI